MANWIASLSKSTLAFLLIAVGIFVIIAADPPRTVCDAELELFRNIQIGFLFPNPKAKIKTSTEWTTLQNHCKATNSPGGCYELFMKLRQLHADIVKMPKECHSDVAAINEVKTALWEGFELMVRLAWGDKPPESFHDKQGWLDSSDMTFFCQLKSMIMKFYGEPNWVKFRERIFTDLPGTDKLSRKQIWEGLILSTNCNQYR